MRQAIPIVREKVVDGRGEYTTASLAATANAGTSVQPSPAATMYFNVSRLVAWRLARLAPEQAASACPRRQCPSSNISRWSGSSPSQVGPPLWPAGWPTGHANKNGSEKIGTIATAGSLCGNDNSTASISPSISWRTSSLVSPSLRTNPSLGYFLCSAARTLGKGRVRALQLRRGATTRQMAYPIVARS